MLPAWNPMRWPAGWTDPSLLEVLKNTPIDCLLIEPSGGLATVISRARQDGIQVFSNGSLPQGVTVLNGEWPGVKLNESGAVDRAAAGPTGAPWVDSNGWAIRLAAALNPAAAIWVEAAPRKPRLFAESYVIGVADAAVHGGRWIISLDEDLAAGIAARKPESVEAWKNLATTVRFFSSKKSWSEFVPAAVLGVVSDFSGKNEFVSHELLNLLARANQQYRVLPMTNVLTTSFAGLRTVIYPDEQPPDAGVRRRILAFVRAGGTLVTGPKWGLLADMSPAANQHPRYSLFISGKGLLAVAKPDFEDPYIVANDAVILMSHRYELLRFWNVGATGSLFSTDPGRRNGVVQVLFYSSARFGNTTLRISERCREARLWTLDRPEPRSVEMEIREGGTEFHLPPVSHYAAVEIQLQTRVPDGS